MASSPITPQKDLSATTPQCLQSGPAIPLCLLLHIMIKMLRHHSAYSGWAADLNIMCYRARTDICIKIHRKVYYVLGIWYLSDLNPQLIKTPILQIQRSLHNYPKSCYWTAQPRFKRRSTCSTTHASLQTMLNLTRDHCYLSWSPTQRHLKSNSENPWRKRNERNIHPL